MPAPTDTEMTVSASRFPPPLTAAVTVTSRLVIPSASEVCRPAAGSASTIRSTVIDDPGDPGDKVRADTSVIETAAELIV